MKATLPLVVTRQYRREAEKWLKAIKRGENVSVIFFPKTDRLRRLQQLLEDKQFLRSILGKTLCAFQVIDFSTSIIEDRVDLEEHIARQLNLTTISASPLTFKQWVIYLGEHKIHLVLVLAETEKYLTPSSKDILSFLSHVATENALVLTTLSFYEVDVTHPDFRSLMPSSGHLYENIYFYPLYAQSDIVAFIDYLQIKWSVLLDKKTQQEIVEACGGHFWLVKEAMRQLEEKKKWSTVDEGFRFRLQTLFRQLLSSEQSVLQKIIKKQKTYTPEESHSLTYFKKMNVVDSSNRCLLGALTDYLLNRQEIASELSIKNDRVILNQVPLDTVFSSKEYRVLKVLLKHGGNVVTRDEIARAIWPLNTQEHYSDWAIDQTIARLRKRFVGLALPSKLLQVVRGKGYLLKIQ